MSNSFYIPIQSMNLAHYLASGIIAPSIYIENKNVDIQDKFKNYLLLSSSKFTKETNCAIEIVFNAQDESPKKISDNFYLFDMPLAISRIKSIYFTNEEQKISTNFNITSGSAFIPERLLKIAKEESIDAKELDGVEYNPSQKNWSEYLKQYDQILGGFSAMKISKEQFQNYPIHYFSTLANINSLFSKILEEQNLNIKNSFQFAFNNEGQFKDFYNTIYSDIDYTKVHQYAENEKNKVDLKVKNGLFQLDKIPEDTNTYLVAILERYGKEKRMQIDSFISDLVSDSFFQKINNSERYKRKEGLSLIFGLNKGYKAFRNKYKTSNFEIDIKFHLDSMLDYYVIESIYQYVFNQIHNILSFSYIDDLFTDIKKEEVKISNYITYQMIDKVIILKKKTPTHSETVLEKISNIISKWFPFSVKKNEIETLFKMDIEFFKNSIELDLENKYKLELEKNKIQIEQLNNSLLEKDKKITQLESKLEGIFQPKIENDLDKEKNIEVSKPKSFENTGQLFSDEMVITRELELKKKPLKDLKAIADQYNLQNVNSFRKKDEVIIEIIKFESKQ